MKSLRLAAVVVILASGLLATTNGQGTLQVNSFTDSQITVTVTGTVTGPAPAQFLRQLYLYSSIPAEDDWVLQSVPTSAVTASGSPIVGVSYNLGGLASVTGAGLDYIIFDLSRDLSTTDVYTGLPVTLTFPANTFNPSALNGDFVLAWGYNGGSSTPFGQFQSQGPVPEPSAFALVSSGMTGLLLLRRRLRA